MRKDFALVDFAFAEVVVQKVLEAEKLWEDPLHESLETLKHVLMPGAYVALAGDYWREFFPLLPLQFLYVFLITQVAPSP